MELDHLCMGCMGDKGAAHVCPLCGYNETRAGPPAALALRTELNQQYLVGRVLGSPGGFGITYLAWDMSLATPVALKEYKPRGLVERGSDRLTIVPQSQEDEEPFREGLTQFRKEAQLLAQLAQLNHPNIVRVRSFFEANGTGYMVMDYYRGMDLEQLRKQQGTLSPKTALWLMLPILRGLWEVHQLGVLHRDIKPANIYITERKQPVLLDFGAGRIVSPGYSRGLTAIRTPGFAPYEQEVGGKQGPWTDIYACGATLYFLLSGRIPPPASDRKGRDELVPLEQLIPSLPPNLSDAVMQALAVDWEKRPQDIKAFEALLTRDGQPVSSMATIPPTVASIIVTCAQCNVTNSVPAGRSLTDTRCAQCAAPLSAPVTAPAPSSQSTQNVTQPSTSFSIPPGKGRAIAVALALLVLLLGVGVWAKGYLEEERAKRITAEQELQRKAEEDKRKVAELQEQRKADEAKRLQEEREQLAAQKARLEEDRRAAAAAERRQEEAARRRERERLAAEEEERHRVVTKPTTPSQPAEKHTDTLDSITDMACKLWGHCDSNFRSGK
ncbi:MAG: protein kinase [Deltaproteobacteria bacterium]|nr:protein kinase [Deltaproteobacteria bacterium]